MGFDGVPKTMLVAQVVEVYQSVSKQSIQKKFTDVTPDHSSINLTESIKSLLPPNSKKMTFS